MKFKFDKLSTEKLEAKLKKLQKWTKVLNWLLIISVVLTVLMLLVEENISTPLGLLVLSGFLKFIMYPMQIGAIKTELNNRSKNVVQQPVQSQPIEQSAQPIQPVPQFVQPQVVQQPINEKPVATNKFCSKCGVSVNGDSKFCTDCGSSVE